MMDRPTIANDLVVIPSEEARPGELKRDDTFGEELPRQHVQRVCCL
jgi:hypothetical protein